MPNIWPNWPFVFLALQGPRWRQSNTLPSANVLFLSLALPSLLLLKAFYHLQVQLLCGNLLCLKEAKQVQSTSCLIQQSFPTLQQPAAAQYLELGLNSPSSFQGVVWNLLFAFHMEPPGSTLNSLDCTSPSCYLKECFRKLLIAILHFLVNKMTHTSIRGWLCLCFQI